MNWWLEISDRLTEEGRLCTEILYTPRLLKLSSCLSWHCTRSAQDLWGLIGSQCACMCFYAHIPWRYNIEQKQAVHFGQRLSALSVVPVRERRRFSRRTSSTNPTPFLWQELRQPHLIGLVVLALANWERANAVLEIWERDLTRWIAQYKHVASKFQAYRIISK